MADDPPADDTPELTLNTDSPDPVLHIQDAAPLLELTGYDTDGDEEAGLCCSECGEPVEGVTHNEESEISAGPAQFTTILGFVCGCSETPAKWTVQAIDTDPDDGGEA